MSLYREHPVVLLGGSYNAVSAARSLGRSGCQVHIGLAAAGGDFVVASKYVTSWMRPTSEADTARQWLDWLCHRVPPGSVVLACSDPAMELVAEHRATLTAAGLLPNEADDQLVLALLDKQRTYELARDAGVRAPRTEVVHNLDQALAVAASFDLPFAIKPRWSFRFLDDGGSAPKAVVVGRRGELEPALRQILALDLPVILTEIVPGSDEAYCSYYSYVDDQGRSLVRFTKRKLRQYPVGFGSGTFHLTDANPEVADLGARLFAAVGLRGLGNVEFKRDARDGQLTLIECNLRLTAATELVRRAGIDLADLAYRRALGMSVEPVEGYREGLSQWLPMRDLLALRQYRTQGAMSSRQWLVSIARPHTLPLFSLSDAGPTVSRSVEVARRLGARASPTGPARPGPRRGGRERLLRAAVTRVPAGKLTGALLAEAAVLSRLGIRDYRSRWAVNSPLQSVPAGRSELYRGYWSAAATFVGAEVVDLHDGLQEIRRGAATTLVWGSLVPLDNPVSLRLAGDKLATRVRLTAAGLPMAEQLVCGVADLPLAEAFLARTGVLVVKPSRGGGGQGVTCGVRRGDQLVVAFALALRFSDQVVLERLTPGEEYRLLVLGGSVRSAVRRRPPSVVGDGRATLAELIGRQNAQRRADPAGAGLYPISLDLDLAFTLDRAGLTLRSVPPRQHRVPVKTAVNENGPADNDLVVPTEAMAHAAVAAAAALGLDLAAVEMITTDPSRPLSQAGGTVVEVNTTPGLHYHYQVTNPDHGSPVAAAVLEHLLVRAVRPVGRRPPSPLPERGPWGNGVLAL